MSKQTALAALAHLNGRPVLLEPTYAETSLPQVLRALANADFPTEQGESQRRQQAFSRAFGMEPAGAPEKPFAYSNGVAFIPVHGLLINRFGYCWGWVTGYDFVRSQLNAANADADVKAIVFDVNSPGGMAWGCEELAQEIRSSGKPTLAVVDANCCSAAYWLASATDKLVLTPSGQAGSIGVYVMHVSYAEAMDQAGVKITFIKAGQRKVDGNPYEVLSDEAKAEIQTKVDSAYAKFVGAVAEHRGLSSGAVEATEARVYDAEEALNLGLVDAVQSPTEAVQAWISGLAGSDDTTEQDIMSQDTQQNQVDTAAVVSAERARIAAIQCAPEAEGRRTLADHLALKTDMPAEAAIAALAAAPKEAAAPTQTQQPQDSAFLNAMNNGRHPDLTAGAGGAPGAQPNGNRLLANLTALGFTPADQATH